jgi:phosphate transport system permease protein
MYKSSSYKGKPLSLLLYIAAVSAMAVTAAVFLLIIGYILIKGVPHLNLGMFALKYTTKNVSLFPALVNTVTMTLTSLIIAVPLGICSAIYLVEYARRGNKLVVLVRMTAETLSGIPSIVYGLFGLLFFVTALRWRFSLLAGAFTLSIMILPLIMRTTEEALQSVSDSYREASFGLGAGKLRTVFRVVLPSAVPGILAGVILAVGRIVGETAALIYTAGTVAQIPSSLMGSGGTLSVHMHALQSEGMHIEASYATAVVLVLLVVGINALSGYLARKIVKGPRGNEA